MPEGSGRVAGYHCWAEFYVRGAGWIPVDPAEASTSADASRKAFLFGNLDADRVEFTTGRDIELDPPTHEPLNYFIYPYAEADGQPAGSTSISFEYKDVTLPNLGAGHATGGVTRTRE